MIVKCPVCDGTGLTVRPSWVAGDQHSWVSNSAGPYRCKVCKGAGILAERDLP